MKLLRRNEKEDLFKKIDKDYNCNSVLIFKKLPLFMDSENNLYLVTKDYDKVDLKEFRIKSAGLLIGHFLRGFIFTVEGSRLIGNITKNIANLDIKQIQEWVKGKDIRININNGLYIVKHNNDFFGSGFLVNGILKNYLDKSRVIKENVELN